MKTIILNGSPKGDSATCNSRIFAQTFVSRMKNPCEVKCIAGEDSHALAKYIEDFDALIIVLPLYIHAMPGIVMKLIEAMQPAKEEGKHIGFIIQAGFMETSQERFVAHYFADLARQLNYNYLGTVSKGQAAALYMYPKMFKKVLKLVADLGVVYEQTHSFDKAIAEKLGAPYDLSKGQLRLLNLANKTGLDNMFWHKILKQNNAFDKRLDRPFA
ncbi:MAG: NAD(P)H dehydrogenase [Clostridia bacterium]|nr:NAD(P)H dehydrogenase [Clostridia bacterium]